MDTGKKNSTKPVSFLTAFGPVDRCAATLALLFIKLKAKQC